MAQQTAVSEKSYPTGPIARLLGQIERLEQFKNRTKQRFDELTEREIEILSLVASGLNNPAIAKKLDISRATVQNHRSHIREKLDISNPAEYIRYALAFDLIRL